MEVPAGNESDVDENGFEVVDETPESRATVKMEVHAKVDSNHPDARLERMDRITCSGSPRTGRAHLDAGGRTGAHQCQTELGMQEGLKVRTRDIAAKRSAKCRTAFQKRRASIDPNRPDPRAELKQE